MCQYFDDITKFESFDLDNTLIDETSFENISVYYISYKTSIATKPVCYSIKKMDLLEFIISLDIQYYLEAKKIFLFTTGQDILQE